MYVNRTSLILLVPKKQPPILIDKRKVHLSTRGMVSQHVIFSILQSFLTIQLSLKFAYAWYCHIETDWFKGVGTTDKSSSFEIALTSFYIQSASHIPFRDSKLTRILQPSLSGNAKVAVICTVSPVATSMEESINTLKFAERVKLVVTSAKTNEVITWPCSVCKWNNSAWHGKSK